MIKLREIVNTLKVHSKHSDMIEMTNEIIETLQVDDILLEEILDKLNSKKINAYDLVKVEGFFNEYGCLEIPRTFTKLRVINEGMSYLPNKSGELERVQKTRLTPPLLPSIYPDEQDNYKIGFLYSTHENNFEIMINDSNSIQISEFNKFVPFMVANEMYYKYCQKYVRMICEIVPLNIQLMDELVNIEDDELTPIIEYFHNDYNPFITSYILVCRSIEDIPQKQFKLNRTIWFVIEYEILNSNIGSNAIYSKFASAYKKINHYNLPISFRTYDDNEVFSDNSDGIQTILIDNYIGFYKEVHPDNLTEYRKDMILIEDYINQFLSAMKLKCSLHYISDYRLKKKYESIIK